MLRYITPLHCYAVVVALYTKTSVLLPSHAASLLFSRITKITLPFLLP